jgi:hypothetical protein
MQIDGNLIDMLSIATGLVVIAIRPLRRKLQTQSGYSVPIKPLSIS